MCLTKHKDIYCYKYNILIISDNMELKIIGKKTGQIVYQCVTTGDPMNPSSVSESGIECKMYKEMMDTRYEKLDDYTKYITMKIDGGGAYLIARKALGIVYDINKEAGEELFEVKINDLPEFVYKPDPNAPKIGDINKFMAVLDF